MSADAPTYRIIDEPLPSDLARFATEPWWPLLGLMLVGGWLAWPWFLFNALALRSATRRVEIALIIGAIVAGFIVYFFIGYAHMELGLAERWVPYLALAFPAVKLSAGYLLYMKQHSTWEIFEAFGGKGAKGMIILLVGFFAQGPVESILPKGVFAVVLM